MDKKVKTAIQNHEDYQRLSEMFSLDFVVECMTNSNRGPPAKFIGNLIKKYGKDPSIFITGIIYHELVEFEESRKLGYSDKQLAASNANDQNFIQLHLISKRKELGFHRDIGRQVLEGNPELPFLSIVIATVAPGEDYKIPPTPYGPFCKMVQERVSEGMSEYKVPFTFEDVQKAIELFQLGGDNCSGKAQSLDLARDLLNGRKPPRERTILDYI